ncbi:MAG: glycosyltransferase involved in cell wall biosynthesis [Alphaproteobacteria bacterium]|jgi:glycosyltransferase involved in cell wall biosynthesis
MSNTPKSQDKKILIVSVSMQAGGVTRVCENLAVALSKQGYKASILSMVDNVTSPQLQRLNEHNIGYYSTSNKAFGPKQIFTVTKDYYNFIKNNKFNAIYIACLIPAIVCLLANIFAKCNAKTVVNFHTCLSEYLASQNNIKTAILKSLFFIVRKADILANDSAKAAKDAEKVLGGTKVHCLYNPACTEEELTHTSTEIPHKWLEDKNLKAIVTCGRLCKEKNFSRMLESFALINTQQNNTRLIIVGSGPLMNELQQQANNLNISEYVDFLGMKTNPKEYFFHADHFWLTSNLEGFSLVLAEALSMGTDCMSVDCPHGPREILKDGNIGLLIPFNATNKEMANAVIKHMKKPLEDKLFYRNRASDFTDVKSAERFLELLNDTSTQQTNKEEYK